MTAKSRDRYGRYRSVTVGFRMSPAEAAQLDALVAVSGKSKQEYITAKLLDRSLVVIPNTRVQSNLRKEMYRLYRELRRVSASENIDPFLAESVATLSQVFLALDPETNSQDAENRRLTSHPVR